MMQNHQLQGQAELDDSSQVFRYNYILLTTLGLWPASLSDVRFFLNFGYFCYEMLLEYLDLFLFIDNFENVLMNLTENMAFSQIFIRMLMLRIYNSELGEIIGDAKKDFDAKNYTEEERKTFVAYHVKSRTFMKLLITNTALTASSYYVKPLLGQMGELMEYANSNGENSTFIFMLPYRFYTFYELNDAQTYFWTYGSQLPFVFISGFGQSAADCLMVTLVYHVSGQMAVLALRIASIDTHPSKCTQEVQKIVKAHIRLLRMGKVIQRTFSATLLGHLVGATSLVCILGYQILTSLANGERAILISFFAFIFLVLLVLYAHCTVGESLITESERVSQAYYDCEWYNMSKENARIIILCMARSQKPLQLTAGKFSMFCLQTLTDSIKASMGYLSVLRTVM
ncbi:odorant receptor 289 [Nasonia vitripennis]|uniref:Odorant receptor n=1 Tax=Nasonia vitripennis TaxID=7425 RepID=A0A7M6UE62_NASVI|nr:odorant receptor 289 [Nasonia vitripennis]